MEKKLSAEEVLKKHFQWQWALTISQESGVLSAMEEYASQFKGEAVSDAVDALINLYNATGRGNKLHIEKAREKALQIINKSKTSNNE